MKNRGWIAVGLLLVVSLLLAGCGQEITAEEIVAKVRETVDSTQDAHAMVTATVKAQGIEMRVKAEVWEKSPNKVRAEVLEASEDRFTGTILVSDGQQAWYYEPARNQVMVGEPEGMETPLPQEMLAELQDVIQQVLDVSDVELLGDETVAGRQAYKLLLTPKEDAAQQVLPGDGTVTIWVDQEQWFILKATYEGGALGQGGMEVLSFELNPGLDDALFTYQIPEGAQVVEVQNQEPVPLTLDEARQQAGFPLLVPDDVPEGATLIEVFRAQDSIILRYNHSTQVSFAIVQGTGLASPPPLGESQGITVRGQAATAITDEAGGNSFLYWTENGVTVTIAGHLSLDEAIKVAESLQ
jgi:outer membrane lipoprotein-sorting protein